MALEESGRWIHELAVCKEECSSLRRAERAQKLEQCPCAVSSPSTLHKNESDSYLQQHQQSIDVTCDMHTYVMPRPLTDKVKFSNLTFMFHTPERKLLP